MNVILVAEQLRQKGLREDVIKYIQQRVENLQKRGFDPEQIFKEIQEIAEDPEILNDFGGDVNAAWSYASERIFVRHVSRKDRIVKVETLIPFGLTPLKATKSGKRCSLYCIAKFQGKFEKIELVGLGKMAELVRNVELYRLYKDLVIVEKPGYYEVGNQTNFNNPGNYIEPSLLIKEMGIRKVTMSEFPSNLCRIDENGYSDPFDLRYFEAYVVKNPRKGETDKGEYGVYDVSDGTLIDDYISPDGSIIVPTTVTVWCSPKFCRYGVESKIGILGTIKVSTKDSSVFVDAIYIHPVVVTEILED